MKRIFLFFVILFYSSLLLKAQNLKQHNDFFISKIPEYRYWLKHSNIDQVLKIDTLDVRRSTVQLKLKVWNYTNSQLADKANLDSLNRKIKSRYNKDISRLLFDKYTFLMDLEKSQAEIKIESKDAITIVKTNNGEIIVKHMTKMGEITDNYKIKIRDVKGLPAMGYTTSNETIDAIKAKLLKGLEDNFKNYEAKFEDYDFDPISNLGNELIIEINNVVKLVIRDESYFEHIILKFTFKKIEESVNIEYTIRGKYGSGIVWAPKNSDYYDMSPKYESELERFNIKLKNQIDKIVKE